MNQSHKQKFIEKFSLRILQFKTLILIIIIGITAISAKGLTQLNISVNIEDFFLEDDPIHKEQNEYKKYFKNSDFIGVLVESDDVFSRNTLEIIHDVTNKLVKGIPSAEKITSIVNINSPFLLNKRLKFQKGKIISSERFLSNYKSYYSNIDSLKGTLFSKDNRQAWIHVKLGPYSFMENQNGEKDTLFTIGEKAYQIVQSIDTGSITLTASGVPVYAHRKEKEMLDDLSFILIIGSIVALILAIVVLRNMRSICGTLLVITCTVLTVFGIQGWIGMTIDSAFMAVPIFLTMGVSIGYTVHILRFFVIHSNTCNNINHSITYALKKSTKPIFFTAFTTVVALLSFIAVEIKPIQWVGLTSALSIIIVFILCIVLFPIILSFGVSSGNIHNQSRLKTHFLEPHLDLFSQWVEKYDNVLLFIFCFIAIISLYGITNLKVDFNAEKVMGTELQHMKDQIYVGKSEIATTDTIDLMLALDGDNFADPDNIKKIETLEKKILKFPLVKKVNSIVKVLKSSNYNSHYMKDAYYKIPSHTRAIKTIYSQLNYLAPDYYSSWITDNYSKTRIFIELSDFSSLQIEKNIQEIKNLLKELFPNNLKYSFSGSTYQMAAMNQYITRGLIRSIFTALAIITLIMMIVFKSITLGLIAMIPNVFPVIVAGGLMGFYNIPLEFVTMTVAPMIIGLAVDDTIHLFLHLKDEINNGSSFSNSLSCTFSSVGLAITETTIILCITFLIFIFSQVNNITYMGILTSIGLLTAYLTDIFISPIMIKKIYILSK